MTLDIESLTLDIESLTLGQIRAIQARAVAGAVPQFTWDRITVALLDGIEIECDRAEVTS